MHITKTGKIKSPVRKRTIRFAIASTVTNVIGYVCMLSHPLQLFVIDAGASDIYIGLLNSAIWLGSPFLLIGISMMFRLGKRRSLLYFGGILPAIVLLPLVFAPYLHHKGVVSQGLLLNAVFLMVFFRSAIDSIGGASWFPLLQDNIPQRAAGKFFGSFRVYWQTASMLTTLLIAFFVGKHPEWWRFTIIFVIGELFFISKIFTFAGLAERPFTDKTVRNNPKEAFLAVMSNVQTRTFFLYVLLCNVSMFMPYVFFVKFLKVMDCSSRFIMAAAAMIPVGAILTLKFWGRLSDRYGNRSVFTISHFGMFIALLLWSIVGTKYVSINLAFLLFAMWSMFRSANGIVQTRHMFAIVSHDNQGQIVIINLVTSAAVAISALLGGIIVTLFDKILGQSNELLKYRLLFGVCTILSLAPHFLIKQISHEKDRSTKEVFYITINAMRSMIGSFVANYPKRK